MTRSMLTLQSVQKSTQSSFSPTSRKLNLRATRRTDSYLQLAVHIPILLGGGVLETSQRSFVVPLTHSVNCEIAVCCESHIYLKCTWWLVYFTIITLYTMCPISLLKMKSFFNWSTIYQDGGWFTFSVLLLSGLRVETPCLTDCSQHSTAHIMHLQINFWIFEKVIIIC